MYTFGKLFRWVFSLFSMSFNLYGYSISFWQIFVFLCLSGICAFILKHIFSIFM